MVTRYSRKKVPLEIRGISRSSLDNHEIPVDYVNSVKKAIQRYDSSLGIEVVSDRQQTYMSGLPESLLSGSGSAASDDVTRDEHDSDSDSDGSSDTWQEETHWMAGDEEHTLWHEAGNHTDRTSVSSSDWGDDVCEFDRQESRRVRQMFDEIETMLFEPSEQLPRPHLQHQTSQSSQQSHHHHHHQGNGAAALNRECGEWAHRFPHLRLLGLQLISPQDIGFHWFPMEQSTPRPATGSVLIDVNDGDVHMDSLCLSGTRLTPSDHQEELKHLQEEVLEQDGVVEDMLAVDFRLGEEEAPAARQNRRQQRHHGFPPLTPNAALKDTLTSTMFDSLWSSVAAWMRPVIKESLRRSNLPSAEDTFPDSLPVEPPGAAVARLNGHLRPSLSAGGHTQDGDLSGLLHISIKALQLRERSSLQDIPELPSPLPEHSRPLSSFGARTNPAVQSGALTRAVSARRGRGRLAPLDRAKTPNPEEEAAPAPVGHAGQSGFGLRGRSINPAVERSLVSPGQLYRSGTLPPILPVQAEQNRKQSRIGSGKPLTAALLQLYRPSTSQSFARVETPGFRRSSTPVSLSMGGVLLNMSVQGKGAGNTGAPAEEERGTRAPATNWGSYPPSNSVNNPYRRGKQLSNLSGYQHVVR